MILLFHDDDDDDDNAAAFADIKLSGILTSSLHKYRQKYHHTVMHN